MIQLENYPFILQYNNNKKDKEVANPALKRVEEVNQLLETFLKIIKSKEVEKGIFTHLDIEYIDKKKDAEYLVAEKYYQNLSFFKKYIESENGNNETNVNIFKIISGLELAICEIQPITYNDYEVRKKLNALFGFFTGLGFLTGWFQEDFLKYTFPYPNIDRDEIDELARLLNEHIDWMYMLQSQFHLPYFSNAHTWWALKMLLHELNEKRP